MKKAAQAPAASFFHYLPYSKEDEKLGMVCTTVGKMIVPPGTPYPPRKNEHPAPFRAVAEGRVLKEFQILYITEGRGTFTSGGVTRTVVPGSIFLILPGIEHKYKPELSTGWHEYWIGFSGDYFDNLVKEKFLVPEDIFLEIGLRDDIIAIFNNILAEVAAQQPLFQFRSCSLLLSLLTEIICRVRRNEQPDYHEKIIEKAKYLMRANIYNAINIASISEQLGISASRLNEIFKSYTSMTPYQYYIHIKINKAESILEEKDTSVKEAAFKMGFDDRYYFSRLFKKKTGVSPLEWKKLALKT
ncbi:MAG: helix-turn-helix domain-containing protein [Treponema sp.]|nr:helix-turn-helix domain-containing protein [Treponema sp.]